jgi:muramidase (phage lysozyme)
VAVLASVLAAPIALPVAARAQSYEIVAPPAPLVASVRAESAPEVQPAMPAQRTSLALLNPQSAPAAARYAITPERRALLNTIRFAEGTWARGEDIGYRIMFGGGLMASLERHPDRVNYSGGYASAAAGAYQFMPFTWALAARALGLAVFHPEAQDQAALFLVQRRGALTLADLGELTPQLVSLLAPEWASFPTLRGQSFYGQPVKRFADLKRFYDDNLAQLRLGLGPSEPPRLCEPQDSLRCRLEALDRFGPRSSRPGA